MPMAAIALALGELITLGLTPSSTTRWAIAKGWFQRHQYVRVPSLAASINSRDV